MNRRRFFGFLTGGVAALIALPFLPIPRKKATAKDWVGYWEDYMLFGTAVKYVRNDGVEYPLRLRNFTSPFGTIRVPGVKKPGDKYEFKFNYKSQHIVYGESPL